MKASTVTRRVFLFRVLPGLALASAAALTFFPHLIIDKRTWPKKVLELLGPTAISGVIGKVYCSYALECSDIHALEERLRTLFERSSRKWLLTQAEAAEFVKEMVAEDYKSGNIQEIRGWLVPETLLLLNAYAYRTSQ